MSLGQKADEDAGASQLKLPTGGVRFDRLLSGLGAGTLVEIEPDKLKGDILRWAKAVAALVRQVSFGAWPEKSDGSSEHQTAGDGRKFSWQDS